MKEVDGFVCKIFFICSIDWVNGEGEVYGPFHLFRTCLCIIRFAVFRSFFSLFFGWKVPDRFINMDSAYLRL